VHGTAVIRCGKVGIIIQKIMLHEQIISKLNTETIQSLFQTEIANIVFLLFRLCTFMIINLSVFKQWKERM